MPEILQREGWYPTHQALQSETTDQEHLLEIVTFVGLYYGEFSKLCLNFQAVLVLEYAVGLMTEQ